MAKYYGKIGYATSEEVKPGVWKKRITEREYFGDVIRNTRRLQSSGNLNDNIIVSNEISIVADPYANENFQHMRYIEWMGTKWKITNIEVQYPRLILTLGGIYHEYETNSSNSSD